MKALSFYTDVSTTLDMTGGDSTRQAETRHDRRRLDMTGGDST